MEMNSVQMPHPSWPSYEAHPVVMGAGPWMGMMMRYSCVGAGLCGPASRATARNTAKNTARAESLARQMNFMAPILGPKSRAAVAALKVG